MLLNEQRVTLCFSPDTIEELKRVCSYRKIAAQAKKLALDMDEILHELFAHSVIVKPDTSLALPPLKEDPSDRMFLACAAASAASCIVTGDKVLLTLKEFDGIPIITPRKFIDLFMS